MDRIKQWFRPFYVPVMEALRGTRARRYAYLFDEISRSNAKSILEIGTWNGNRAAAMIKTAAHAQDSADVSYYGFDLFEDLDRAQFEAEISKWPPTLDEVRAKLLLTGARIELFKGNTKQTLPHAIATIPPVDFIFIDGGHSLETIQNDWNYASRLMHERTVVLFDDYWQDTTTAGAKPIVDNIDTTRYDVRVLPVVDRFTDNNFGNLAIQFARVARKPVFEGR